MSQLEPTRAAIVAKLAVLGIGVVHDHEPYAATLAALQALYQDPDSGRLNGWHVRRVATRELSAAIGCYLEYVSWQIRGYFALSEADGSERAFDAQIEAIRDAVRADPTLGGAVGNTAEDDDEAGVQVQESGPVMFAGVLCHAATLRLVTINAL
ncbi:MAG: hypothetical protein KDH15_15705 [Rhodocyclaceae bacterium]|nr:hypothetical protein [Rhodocyclaceae bacterium]